MFSNNDNSRRRNSKVQTNRIMLFLLLLAGCTAGRSKQAVYYAPATGIYTVAVNGQVLQVDPSNGGRIVSLQAGGNNILTGKEVNPLYWGSSLWPSPQKSWKGSVPKALDRDPYDVIRGNGSVKLVSRQSADSGYVFSKEFSVDRKKGAFIITYTVTNGSAVTKEMAPWEVTRVHPGGLSFFPKGSGERWGNMAGLACDTIGITWFYYDRDSIPDRDNKFFSDGSEGWIAHVNQGMIFIKQFPDIPLEAAAPSEAEVELYANGGKTYIEIEQQGAYTTLQPGASLQWQVRWFLRKLPPHIKPLPGNTELVTYVRNLIK